LYFAAIKLQAISKYKEKWMLPFLPEILLQLLHHLII